MEPQTTVFNSIFPKLEKYGYKYEFNGKDLPDATYYYIVKFASSDKVYKGAVTLLHQ